MNLALWLQPVCLSLENSLVRKLLLKIPSKLVKSSIFAYVLHNLPAYTGSRGGEVSFYEN